MKNRKLSIGILSIIIHTLSIAVLIYTQWRGNLSDTLHAVRYYLYMFPVVFILATVGHIFESKDRSCGEYAKALFIGNRKIEDRAIYLDYARSIAVMCVILTHACSSQRLEEAALWKTSLLSIVTAVTLVCNPLYVMLSGGLLLASKKEESLIDFYKNRFVKVVLPFIIYYFMLLCVSGNVDITSASSVWAGIKQILSGATGIAPHYWVLYIFFSFYLVAPFFKKMLQSLSDKQIRELFALLVISLFVSRYAALIGINLGITFEFAQWIGVFLIGYIVLEKEDVISPLWFIVPGALFAVMLIVVAVVNYDYTGLFFNYAPPMVFMSAGIICLLRKAEKKLKKKKNIPAVILSNYSYSIILIHWYGLFVITMGFYPIQPLRFGCVGGILITLIVALMVCLVLGFFIDNTLVTAVRTIGNIPKIIKNKKS